jgi:hypothetical protein
MLAQIIAHAAYFVAGGVTFSLVLLVTGYRLCKRAYLRAARGW